MIKTPTSTSHESIRHSLLLSLASRNKLNRLTEKFHLNQAEVIQTILENMDDDLYAEEFTAVRAAKLSKRNGKTAILAKLKNLTTEQLQALAKLAPNMEVELESPTLN